MKLDAELDLRGDSKTTMTRFSYGALSADSIRLMMLHLRCVAFAEDPCPYPSVNELARKLKIDEDATADVAVPFSIDAEVINSQSSVHEGDPFPEMSDAEDGDLEEGDLEALDADCALYENQNKPNKNAASAPNGLKTLMCMFHVRFQTFYTFQIICCW